MTYAGDSERTELSNSIVFVKNKQYMISKKELNSMLLL